MINKIKAFADQFWTEVKECAKRRVYIFRLSLNKSMGIGIVKDLLSGNTAIQVAIGKHVIEIMIYDNCKSDKD